MHICNIAHYALWQITVLWDTVKKHPQLAALITHVITEDTIQMASTDGDGKCHSLNAETYRSHHNMLRATVTEMWSYLTRSGINSDAYEEEDKAWNYVQQHGTPIGMYVWAATRDRPQLLNSMRRLRG